MTIHQLLKHYWGYSQFRPLQEDIISAVLAGHDTLALLPTGGGKSICFQVPALALEGLCIVVSPLIALMKDQVEQLKKRSIRADAIFSGMTQREIDRVLDNAVFGGLKFLYVSPERLQTELFKERAKRMKVGLLAIDEAHCISQWGYDFRPPYLEIAAFRELLPNVPCIALTATATPEVRQDIQDKLQFSNSKVFQKSFSRPNLSYSVLYEENKDVKLIDILSKVQGTAVVYVQSRRRAKQVADLLLQNRISADFYHAGLSHPERNQKQDAWIQNKTRVIVATNAFGMGIDKPDVRLVVHLDLPNSLEAYYQEAGRAGRDEKKAYAIVLYNHEDTQRLLDNVEAAYPSPEILRHTYQLLANYYNLAVGSGQGAAYDFDITHFQKNFQLEALTTFNALKQLEQEGFIQLSDGFYSPSKLFFIVNHADLYAFQIANAKLDPLIKTLLRVYGGELFNGFYKIDENLLARHLNTSTEIVKKQLEFLHQSSIVSYSPQKEKPQLTFTMPRMKADELPIDIQTLEKFKERDKEKVNSVIAYIRNTQRCRTQQLLAYFGEITDDTCGVCDVCIQEKKAKKAQQNSYLPQIKLLLQAQAQDIRTLIQNLNPTDKQKAIQEIQILVNSGEILQQANGELVWAVS